MKGILASFKAIPEWKLKAVRCALFLCIGGMLWEVNDLLDDNANHPLLSPEASVMNSRFDEYGDQYAIAHKAEPISYAKIWANPLTRMAFAFSLALLAGSLFRTIWNGAIAFILVILIGGFLIGKSTFLEAVDHIVLGRVIGPTWNWLLSEMQMVGQYFWQSMSAAIAAVVGLVLGLLK